jgi:GNAT superfamily N-acetyltransferase
VTRDVTVRVASVGDVDGIGRVARAAYRTAYSPVLGTERVEALLEDWYGQQEVTESVTDSDSRTFVAVDEDGVVGFSSAVIEDDGTGTLGTLYVHPDRWGEGVGSRLLARAGDYLRERGCDRMAIHAFAENEVGVGFYADRAERVDREVHEIRGASVPVTVFERDLR